jgi:hypothetical protein
MPRRGMRLARGTQPPRRRAFWPSGRAGAAPWRVAVPAALRPVGRGGFLPEFVILSDCIWSFMVSRFAGLLVHCVDCGLFITRLRPVARCTGAACAAAPVDPLGAKGATRHLWNPAPKGGAASGRPTTRSSIGLARPMTIRVALHETRPPSGSPADVSLRRVVPTPGHRPCGPRPVGWWTKWAQSSAKFCGMA